MSREMTIRFKTPLGTYSKTVSEAFMQQHGMELSEVKEKMSELFKMAHNPDLTEFVFTFEYDTGVEGEEAELMLTLHQFRQSDMQIIIRTVT